MEACSASAAEILGWQLPVESTPIPEAMSSKTLPLEHFTLDPLAETAMFWERAATPFERWARMAEGALGSLARARDSREGGLEEEEGEVEEVEVENGGDDDPIVVKEERARALLLLRWRRSSAAAAAVAAAMRASSMPRTGGERKRRLLARCGWRGERRRRRRQEDSRRRRAVTEWLPSEGVDIFFSFDTLPFFSLPPLSLSQFPRNHLSNMIFSRFALATVLISATAFQVRLLPPPPPLEQARRSARGTFCKLRLFFFFVLLLRQALLC